MSEETIGSKRFDNTTEFIEAIEELLTLLPSPHTPNEVFLNVGQVFLDEETLTDGSKVYNLRVV